MIFDIMFLGSYPARTDRHRLAGTVTVNGSPASRLIAVFDRMTMSLLAVKLSDPVTGAWDVSGLPEYPVQRLFVVALDNASSFNAEIADYVSQITS